MHVLICRQWNTFTAHWHFVDLYIVTHSRSDVNDTGHCLYYENWTSWLIIYLTRLFIIIIFTYRYNKINDYLRSFSQVVSTFLRSCGVARRSPSTWHIFFLPYGDVSDSGSRVRSTTVWRFYFFSLSIYKIYKGYPLGLIF